MTTIDNDNTHTGQPGLEGYRDQQHAQASRPGDRRVLPAPAPAPAAPAAASYLGSLCAVALVVLGVVGIRDGITAAGWIHGRLWTRTAIGWINGQTSQGWMIPVGIVALLLGLLCLVVGLKPRRKRAVALTARSSVYLDLSDIARVAAATARATPGVVDANARARRHKITVRARTTGADSATQRAAVADAVTEALSPLAHTPKVDVRTSVGGRR